MKINITARHLELTPALREYTEKRLGQVKKFTSRITSVNVVLNIEKDRHIAEVTIGISKNKINAKAIATDMYAAMDIVMDKVIKQLKKHLEKQKDHKYNSSYPVVKDFVWNEENEENIKSGELMLEEVRELRIKDQHVHDALRVLKDRDLKFWIFRDLKGSTINVVYRKEEGACGMLIVRM